jgi:hypothetical protein
MKEARAFDFVYEGRTYHIAAKYYKRNSRSFIRVQWHDTDGWIVKSYPESAILYWNPLGNGVHSFREKRGRYNDTFVQSLGEFLHRELHLEGVHY